MRPAAPWYVVTALALVLGACASPGGGDAAAPEAATAAAQQAPMAAPDPDEQRAKAVTSRVAAGIEALKARDAERARRHIRRALEIDPDSAEAQNAMALYYRYEGDDKREEQHYRKAIRADSSFSQARNNYAALLYRQGRYREAIVQLRRAADDPNYDQRPMAWMNLGRCYLKTREYADAATAFQRVMRLDVSMGDAQLEYAYAQHELGNDTEARAYLGAYAGRGRHTARSLWLGIRIEHALGDADRLASHEFQLDQMFKGSAEHKAWLAWKDKGRPARPDDTGKPGRKK